MFITDGDGKLEYVTLPSALGFKAFNCHDPIPEELLVQCGLVNEMSGEMLKAINSLEFGKALQKLINEQACNYSFKLLENITGVRQVNY